MINAVHALMYCKDAAKARAFFRDVMGWTHVDAGEGWLIFAMPPAEMGIHPVEDAADDGKFELYFMCDDLKATLASLKKKGVKVVGETTDQGYGIFSAIQVPGGGKVGIYEPRHALAWKTALKKTKKPAKKAVAKRKKR